MQNYFVGGLRHHHKETEPTLETFDDDQPSPRFTSFCGVTLDQAQHGQLSAFHPLGDDGDATDLSDEWDAMAKEVGGLEVISSLSSEHHPLT